MTQQIEILGELGGIAWAGDDRRDRRMRQRELQRRRRKRDTMAVADRLPQSLCLLLGVLLEQGRVAHEYLGLSRPTSQFCRMTPASARWREVGRQ